MANGSVSRTRSSTIARLPAVAASLAVAMMLGACAGGGEIDLGLADKPQTTDIATASAEPRSESELEKATAYWAEQHTKNPRDAKAAVSYAQNLKALGRKSQALAALQAGYVHSPTDRPLLSEYGRLALELGQVSTAAQLLERADDAAKPDWRVVSARGTVLAKQGQYKDAITLYERALALSPSQASVMNNLAMAYTMDGQAARGEELLRQAQAAGATDPRVKQNLALVLGLQGKPDGSAPVLMAPLPIVQASATQPAAAPQIKSANWDAPLPMETKAAAGSKKSKTAAAKPVDPDHLVQQALAAEQAKAAQR